MTLTKTGLNAEYGGEVMGASLAGMVMSKAVTAILRTVQVLTK